MKLRLIFAATLALSFTLIDAADAQYRNQDPDKGKTVAAASIESWTPQAGPVGSVVSVNGTGFTRNILVLVGGRRVRPIKMGSRVISFKIPDNFGDGQIVMRQAGVAQDYNIGKFQVWADPLVTSFSPSSGAPGTRVEIRGSNFNPDDLVMLGTQRLAIEKYTPSSIIVTIPPAAVSGSFHIQNSRRASGVSRQQFNVVAPAPFISSFSPTQGQPGTVVRIQGGHFDSDVQVRFGRQTVPVNQSGPNWIEITIPENARRSASISISSKRGGSRSASNFDLEMPPALGSFSPSWGGPGTRVTISGQNFRAEDRITLGGQECSVIQIRDRQITVEVPRSARSGTFALLRGSQLINSASQFDVFYSPVLSSMSPLRGPPGTRVVLNGDQLAGAQLYIGNLEIRPVTSLPNQIHFDIPERAQTGTIRVTARGGSASYAENFEVWNFPGIKRLSPSRGAIGATVTISGDMMNNVSAIFLGDIEMPILSRAASNSIVARVPNGAVSGPISWTAYGRNNMSDEVFTVLRAPGLTSFSPTAGSAGSTVKILGDNFDKRTRVRYGNQNARVIQWEPNTLTVVIPPNARQSDYLSVQGDAAGTTASTPFNLLIAPSARSFSPRGGKPGSELTVFGSGLAMDTLVQVGTATARVLRSDAQGVSLTVLLPELASGSYDLSVQSRGMRTVARKRVSIEGWANVTDIEPSSAKVGERIQLRGSGLADARVFFGSRELPVVKADRRGRLLWVTIPENCSGSSVLTVDDQGHRSTTAMALAIEEPSAEPETPDAPPRVHDYRKKKGGKVKVRRR